MSSSKPHIAILGSGPTGLEAALAASEKGFPFTVFESAPAVAGRMREWGHVALFTPWSMNVSERMRGALSAAGREPPATDGRPSGAELVDRVLDPVAALGCVIDHVRLNTRVLEVGRVGLLKHEEIGSGRRAEHAFRLLLSDGDGREWAEEADIVLDCTGNPIPNPIGEGGIAAPGEAALGSALRHEVPDLTNDSAAWTGKSTLLVGDGHSAQTALVRLIGLTGEHAETRIVWVTRGSVPEPLADDSLAGRADLTASVGALAATPPDCLTVLTRTTVEGLRPGEPIMVTLRGPEGEVTEVEVDRVLALTGRVGDHTIYRQLQVHECWATSGPMKLAAALMAQEGGGVDCLDQTSLGPETLRNPEPGFFILGIKSYGRRGDFLMRVGWEQVEEVFQLIETDGPLRGCA
ncbi:MAG: NAD(P)-binding domain-containing protein [Gemmatimonadota bacterium]|nr:MAG: NAD(P)-binding domain-containing protein [Gemmatimonadota bacterium]